MSLIGNRLNVTEAANFVGASVSFIRNRINDGRLPCVKIGNRAYIEPADLEKLITPQDNEQSEIV